MVSVPDVAGREMAGRFKTLRPGDIAVASDVACVLHRRRATRERAFDP